jgi:hypothetical protein
LRHSASPVFLCWIFFLSFFLSFFFLWYWCLNSGPISPATPPALFLWWVFQDMVSWTICPGWLRTMILLISASWVARITGVSHWHPIETWDS